MRPTPSSPPIPPAPANAWSTGRVLGTIAAAALLLIGVLLVLAGAGVAAATAALRHDDGFLRTTTTSWTSPGHAVRSESVELHRAWMMPDVRRRMMGTVEVTAASTTGRDVFIGLAPTSEVDAYLRGTAQSTVTDAWGEDGPRCTYVGGRTSVRPPGAQSIWVARSEGPGSQTLRWEPRAGSWTLVVMNADGSAPVAAEVRLAAELPVLNTVGATLLVSGLVVTPLAGLGLWLAAPRTRPTHHQE